MNLRVAWDSWCWVCAWLEGGGHEGEEIQGERWILPQFVDWVCGGEVLIQAVGNPVGLACSK
ncbi:unnamed protein product [Prunus armeniaca]|uniref:Uncharacterized protein n=1 Tax=Prunus armeniaca TaxID=36596 RepID=A0A6J5VAG0_PRUAR|nr:unnamed protein product [Prunus armeniaca]